MASDDNPRSSSPLLWLLGFLAVGLGALFGLRQAADLPQPAKGPEEARREKGPDAPADEGASDPLDVLRDFLRVEAEASGKAREIGFQLTAGIGGSSFSASADRKGTGTRSKRPLSVYLRLEPAEYEFLIATVPDPVDSRFPHEFDSVVDGIQRAFEARGFPVRASRMPWPHGRGREQAPVAADSSRSHRQYPGVLLFRKSRNIQEAPGEPGDLKKAAQQTIAVVCLVGESPVSGVHMPALTRALAARRDLEREMAKANEGCKDRPVRWTRGTVRPFEVVGATGLLAPPGGASPFAAASALFLGGPKNRIRIVAPHFSGSQASLILALRHWRCTHDAEPPFQIINGSATELQGGLFNSEFLPHPVSTVIPNKLVTLGVLRYLAGCRDTDLESKKAKEHVIEHRVAFLREANTGFGARFGTQLFGTRPDESDLKAVTGGVRPLDLPFPISISQLAARRDQNGKPEVVLPRTDFVEPKLPVRDLNHPDTVPPYDPESAASTAGHSLRAIMTTIERARVRYVGIVATDARDVVYLTRLLRTQCPNVRVFTTEASVAFFHPEDSIHLRGMVVGSTYPLVPGTQYWAQTALSPPRTISFPTQSTQGYYNAVLAQFGRHDLMLGYHPPLVSNKPDLQRAIRDKKSGKDLTDTQADEFDRPPIWISVVGQGGRLVPAHCYTAYKEGSPVFRSTMTPEVAEAHGEKTEGVRTPEHRPSVAIPVGVLVGSLGSVGALAVVIVALLGLRFWSERATGPTQPEVPGEQVPERYWVQVWRGVMRAGSWLWRKGAAGLKQSEAVRERLPESIWVEVWRGVMLAGILLFALPYTLPVQELWDACCEPRNWRQWFVVGAAVLIVVQVAIILWLLLLGERESRNMAESPASSAPPSELMAEKGRRYLGLMVVVGIAAGLAVWRGLAQERVERFFLYVRATDLTAGMSPIVPMGLLGAAVFALGYCGLRQADLARRVRLECPFPEKSWKAIKKADEALNEGLKNPLVSAVVGPGAWLIFLALGLPFFLYAVWNTFEIRLPSDEGLAWDWIMLIIFWAAAAAVVLTLIRFLVLWSQLGKLLGEIIQVPMVGAFERLPDAIGQLFGGYLYAMEKVRHQHLTVLAWMLPRTERADVAQLLGDDYKALEKAFKNLGLPAGGEPVPSTGETATTGDNLGGASGSGGALGAVAAAGDRAAGASDSAFAKVIREKAERYITENLPDVWAGQSVSRAFGVARAAGGKEDEKGKAGEGAGNGPTEPDPAQRTLDEREGFVAAVVVLYLGQYFAQLRQLVWALVFAPPLLLFAAASYPFQPDRPWLTAVVALLGAVAAGIVYVLYRINRDALVSRVTRTTPGRFTPDPGFLSSLTSFVLPVLAVLALQVLGLFRFVLEPILGLLQ